MARPLQRSVNSAQTVNSSQLQRFFFSPLSENPSKTIFLSCTLTLTWPNKSKTLPLSAGRRSVFPTDQSDVVLRDRPSLADSFFSSYNVNSTFPPTPTLISRDGIGPKTKQFERRRRVFNVEESRSRRCGDRKWVMILLFLRLIYDALGLLDIIPCTSPNPWTLPTRMHSR